jgi:glucose-6-phosphate isomerase
VIKSWLQEHAAFDKKRVVMTTDPKSGPLRAYADAGDYTTLPVPELIGGRYSVFTPVGLLPLAYAGVDLAGIAQGITESGAQGLSSEGVAAKLASSLVWSHLAEARPMVVVWPYGERLQPIGRWFQQLWAESLGKAQLLDGTKTHTGSTPIACVGPNDQHSLLQLFGDGPRDKHYLFLCAEKVPAALSVKETIGGAEFLAGRDLQEILRAEARATAAALASQGMPCSFIWLDDMSAKTMARLFTDLMSATVIGAELYGVDPFDQPAVELGKKIALGLLGHPAHKALAEEMTPFLP